MTTQHVQLLQPSLLEQLPGELQNKIIDLLSYVEAVRLSSANKYFQSIVDPQAWPLPDKKRSLHEAERWRRYNKAYFSNRFGKYKEQEMTMESDGYACFSCFKILEKIWFSRNQTERRGAKSSNRYKYVGHKRFCIDCGIRTGAYLRSTFLIVVAEQWLVIHSEQTSWCNDIRTLVACLNCDGLHEYTNITPSLCIECQRAVLASNDPNALKMLEAREKGYSLFECRGCEFVHKIREKQYRGVCSECFDEICGKCSSNDPSECACFEPNGMLTRDEAMLMSVRRLFRSDMNRRGQVADALEDDKESDVLRILNF